MIDFNTFNPMQNTRDFYRRKSSEWLGAMDVPSYVVAVVQAMHQEETRCTQYLSSVTRPKLLRIVLVECVVAHADRVFDASKEMLCAMYDNSQVRLSHVFADAENLVKSILLLRVTGSSCLRTKPLWWSSCTTCAVWLRP